MPVQFYFSILLLTYQLLIPTSYADFYNVTVIGATPYVQAAGTKLAVEFELANGDEGVIRARADLREAEKLGMDNTSAQKAQLKQALLAAQERLLPHWARWKAFRASSPSNPFRDDGSFIDWKTSEEDDSYDSLTWLNEFFHPSAFVKRNTRVNGTTVYYQDYDPKTGVPFDEGSFESQEAFSLWRSEYGPNITLARLSTLDQRPERKFLRKPGGPCRYSVPFFSEPLMQHEEGVQFYVSSNGNVITTSYSCGLCASSTIESSFVWPGIYLLYEDLNPSKADRSIPPLNPYKNSTTMKLLEEGFSGIWIDRYVYPSPSSEVGIATHGATANANEEDLTDTNRQVSVVLTYENVPTYGPIRESNFTGQLELFTNGTIILRYRSLPQKALGSKSVYVLVYPILTLSEDMYQYSLTGTYPPPPTDQYNNTDMSHLPLVAIRFDLKELSGVRGEASIRAAGRCGRPSQLDETLIPAGQRRGSRHDCSARTDCESCVRRDGPFMTCFWCRGYHTMANATPTSGVCLSTENSVAYCNQFSLYLFCDAPITTNQRDPLRGTFYNISVLSVPHWESDEVQNLVGVTIENEQLLGEVTTGIAASIMRFRSQSEFVTRVSAFPPKGNVPFFTSQMSNVSYYGPWYVRRQTNPETLEWLYEAAANLTGAGTNIRSGCALGQAASRAYYGKVPEPLTVSAQLELHPPIPVFYSVDLDVAGSRYASVASFFEQGTQGPIGLRLNQRRTQISSPNLLLSLLSDVDANNQLTQMCWVQSDQTPLMSVQRSIASSGEFDIFYSVSPSGAISVACLNAMPRTEMYVSRMAQGIEPFNTWYLQEAIPPVSFMVLRGINEFFQLRSEDLTDSVPLVIPQQMILRPGRMVTFMPQRVCPPCGGGFCNKIHGACECMAGYTGRKCDECNEKGKYFYAPTTQCLSCEQCKNGACHPSGCICNEGFTGPNGCESYCPNGALDHYTDAKGNNACGPSTCRGDRGFCQCSVCICNQSTTGEGCIPPPDKAPFSSPDEGSQTIYFFSGIAVGVLASLIAVALIVSYRCKGANNTLESLRIRLWGSEGDQTQGNLVGPPVSSASRELIEMLQTSPIAPRGGGQAMLRVPLCVSEPDVYEPPTPYFDDGSVDFF